MDRSINKPKNWYALYVNVRHEKRVGQKLHEKGIESYVPLVKKVTQWSDRKKTVLAPLISGYVFVRVADNDLDKPRFVSGVVSYVRFQGEPAIIRNAEIEALKYFIENGYVIESESEEVLSVGDRVQFGLTDFKSFIAVVESLVGDRYAIVTFEGMSKNFRLKAPVKALRKR